MAKQYFPSRGKIAFEGTSSKNPMAFRYYEPERVVKGRKMKDWLRFSMAWWHTLCAEGADQFGGGTKRFGGTKRPTPSSAKPKMDAGFEFMQKMGIEYYCFHDVDLVDEDPDPGEYEANLREIVAYAKQKQAETGIKLLWGTANVFSNARYMNGASTNPDFDTAARAMLQIKNAIDATIELGGENYVFWGGREGYMSLLNTDMKRGKGTHGHHADDGPRLCPLERLQGQLPDRTQAHGADEAPVRRRHRDWSSASCAPTASTRISRSTSRSTTRRWRATPSSTNCNAPSTPACWARSTPTAATTRTAGTPTSSHRPLRNGAGHADGDRARRRSAGRRHELRRQDAPQLDRSRGSLHRPHPPRWTWMARALLIAADLLENSPYERCSPNATPPTTNGRGQGLRGGQTHPRTGGRIRTHPRNPPTHSGKQELYETLVNLYI